MELRRPWRSVSEFDLAFCFEKRIGDVVVNRIKGLFESGEIGDGAGLLNSSCDVVCLPILCEILDILLNLVFIRIPQASMWWRLDCLRFSKEQSFVEINEDTPMIGMGRVMERFIGGGVNTV